MLGATCLGLISGCLGTLIGGIIGLVINSNSNKVYASILEFTAGLMMAVVCFTLIPEAMEISSIGICVVGYLIGIGAMFVLDRIITVKETDVFNISSNSGYMLGILVAISIAIHNFPEGLAIGSGYEVSATLGLSLFIAIAFHDVPEGASITLLMKKNKKVSKKRMLTYVFLTGVPTGIGALIGYLLGNISSDIVGICLSFAGGVMAYVVMGNMLVESKKAYSGGFATACSLMGIVAGLIVCNL